ncbi:MAG TPA: ATP-binding cassette domain-containing protein [Fusibacter sp.]|nr:ATP-binding cassette domain-containing protein [Fusibacter sp.]
MKLDIHNLKFKYSESGPWILDNINMKMDSGEIVAVVGNSGCGKSTLLRIISGLESRAEGVIKIGDTIFQSTDKFIPAEKRQLGFVFQDYALFPFMTVTQNIRFALKKNDAISFKELVQLTRLEGLENRYPHELSGGQQQRVAVARTLASNPKILLMDEPFSNLDAALVREIRSELRQIIKNWNLTTIIVTHSIEDAEAFADRTVKLGA